MTQARSTQEGTIHEWRDGGFLISTDPARIDLDVVHGYLTRSYWAPGISRGLVARSVRHSLPFSLWTLAAEEGGEPQRQVGFARVVTDYATFAYIADVFILEEWRGRGLSKWLVRVILAHPELQGLRRWILATRDAHGLYLAAGFTPLAYPDKYLEIYHADAHLTWPAGSPPPSASAS